MDVDTRSDSWQNVIAGLGTHRDKATQTQFSSNKAGLSPKDLESLYLEDDIAARVCELLPNEMLRQGFNLEIEDQPELEGTLQDALSALGFQEKLNEAILWSRVFGAAAIFMGVDDGESPGKPLQPELVKGVHFLRVIVAPDLVPKSFYSDPLLPKYGECEVYEVGETEIHDSRLIIFRCGNVSLRKSDKKAAWPSSVLERIYPVLKQFNLCYLSMVHLMSDSSQAVFKLKGLHNAIASNKSEEILKRMEIVDMSRSVSRSILLDTEGEEFTRDACNFSGVSQIVDKMTLRLAAAARLPVALLTGQSPSGLNATGQGDIRFFYDQVRAEQEALKPIISRFTRLLMESLNIESSLKVKIDFPALWQLSDKEKAEIEHMQSETDCRYVQEGVLLPEEVAMRRFSDQSGNIDLTLRKEISESERRATHGQS